MTEKKVSFIGDAEGSELIRITEVDYPRFEIEFGGRNKDRTNEIIEVEEFIGIKSYRAKGKRLSNYEVKLVKELDPIKTKVEELQEAEQEKQEKSPEKDTNGDQMSFEFL